MIWKELRFLTRRWNPIRESIIDLQGAVVEMTAVVVAATLEPDAVMRDEDACKTARTRARARRASGRTIRCEALAGPLEIAFVTREGLAAMPARPGTVDLARQGRVLHGDAGVLDALPRWTPAAIPAEERLLLLENRAFELLWALSGASEGLPALRARHAVLKVGRAHV